MYKRTIRITIIIFLTAVTAAVLHLLGLPCIQRLATGISCPGCGLTRAYISLFSGNIPGAFHCHPLFFLIPIVPLIFFLKDAGIIGEGTLNLFLEAAIFLMVIVYICRLISPYDQVVTFAPEEGLVFRFLRILL